MRTLREQMLHKEREVLISAGSECGWILARMALALGVSGTTISRKLREHDISQKSERAKYVGEKHGSLFGVQATIAEVYGTIKV